MTETKMSPMNHTRNFQETWRRKGASILLFFKVTSHQFSNSADDPNSQNQPSGATEQRVVAWPDSQSPQIAQLTTPSFLHYIGGNWKQQTYPFRAVLPSFLSVKGR